MCFRESWKTDNDFFLAVVSVLVWLFREPIQLSIPYLSENMISMLILDFCSSFQSCRELFKRNPKGHASWKWLGQEICGRILSSSVSTRKCVCYKPSLMKWHVLYLSLWVMSSRWICVFLCVCISYWLAMPVSRASCAVKMPLLTWKLDTSLISGSLCFYPSGCVPVHISVALSVYLKCDFLLSHCCHRACP